MSNNKCFKLCIDFGNTRTKCAVFENDDIVFSEAFEKFTLAEVKKIFKKFPDISASIVCSVIKTPKNIVAFLDDKTQLTELNHYTKIPLKNKYASPETLGKDRLAVSCGALSLFSKTNLLIINCGTCITYDFVNSKQEYLGGSISLGLEMRLKALHHFTQKLPFISKKEIKQLIGTDTSTSILTGVINGTVAELEGIIKNYEAKYSGLQIVITGGDADFLKKHLKNRIFAAPNLTLIGLNSILNHLQIH